VRYLITGGSGYIGSRLTEILAARDDVEAIINLDVRPPSRPVSKSQFVRGDVRDYAGIRTLIDREQPDALVHLAFVLNPIRDEARMYDIDVNGTAAVLRAAADGGTEQVLVTSSATAYGAFPDNPVPLTEDDPVRGVASFSYARDKTESDRICQLWAAKYPDRVMTIARPCIVFGPNVDNYLVRLWTKQALTFDAGNLENPIQFVHEEDVVDALAALLLGRHAGAFNVAGDGEMSLRECTELIGTPIRRLPARAYRGIARAAWGLRASEVPPGQLDFALHPWVVSNEKLRRTAGWTPRYTSRETFELTMRAHGKLPPAEPPAATELAAEASAS